MRLLWWLLTLIFPALARHRSPGQNICPPRRQPSSEPGENQCTTPPPAEPADEPATTATTSVPSAAAIFVPTARDGDRVDAESFGFFEKSTPPVDDAPTRKDLVDALQHMSGTAQALRRQGYTGIYGQSYTRIHNAIDGLLYDLAAMDLEASIDV